MKKPIVIRAGSGLGDSLYLQSIARHLVEKGHSVEACSDWPDVFRPLNGHCVVTPFRRTDINLVCHYTQGKTNPRTTQWQDCCARAGIRSDPDLRLDWKPINTKLIAKVRSGGKPVVSVLIPREPMDRKDKFGHELLPNCAVIQRAIDHLKGKAKVVQVGSGDALFQFSGLDLNLANNTSVSDLIDVAYASDALLGYVSFFVPLAESLDKPALFVWSRRGTKSQTDYINTITPKKILHGKKSRAIFDDCDDDELVKAVDALLDAV